MNLQPPYIWQHPDWPQWRWDWAALVQPLADTSAALGRLHGRLTSVGLALRDQASVQMLTEEVLKTSAIEGEPLPTEAVRSSIARRLGVDIGALAAVDRSVEGVVEMVLDATQNPAEAVSAERLWAWHAALFPTGYSGLRKIRVAAWRDDAHGPMQVVSGPFNRSKIHFEAPPASQLAAEIDVFLSWLNAPLHPNLPPLLKAGLGHLWLVTLHPFDDGNGRIARAVGDLLLARADGSSQRFYSLSAAIQRDRKGYYDILERTQRQGLEVTAWLLWFLQTLHLALEQALHSLEAVLHKVHCWQVWALLPLNARQIKVLNRLLDGFEGKLSSSKYAALAKCSSDTALRDLQNLVALGVLRATAGGGRSVGYEVA